MPTLSDAVALYLEREAQAMAKPQGADHKAILRAGAEESGHSYEALRGAVLDETAVRAN